MIFSKQHMASQLRDIGDRLKQEVKMENTAEDDDGDEALRWGENVEGDATMEEDEMEEVIEEPPPHPYHNVWTKQDTEAVKRGDGMVPQTVEVLSDGECEGGEDRNESWGNSGKGGKGSSKGRYVAPCRKKTKAAATHWIVKVDDWGGKRYNSGWYEWRGTWYPNLLLDSG